ncbi:MAG: response regulator transcription factor [Pseudomonadota bacterium]
MSKFGRAYTPAWIATTASYAAYPDALFVEGPTAMSMPIAPAPIVDAAATNQGDLGEMRILLADDHELVRDSIAAFLSAAGFDQVAVAGSLEEAIEVFQSSTGFGLVLLDLNMPGMGGLEGLYKMQAVAAEVPVAIISGSTQADRVKAAIDAGAQGYLPKAMPAKSICAAIRFMVAGEIYLPYNLMKQETKTDVFGLSARERDVLRWLAEGLSNKEIGLKLGLQDVTVKLHLKTLSRKLKARNRTHAAMLGRDNGLI